MKTRIKYAFALCCVSVCIALAQTATLDGTWVTDGVAAVEAAKKAGKSLNGMAEGTKIKFKVDAKKNKVSGTITQLNSDKEYEIQDGKVSDKTFTFKSIEIIGFTNNNANNNRGGAIAPPPPLSWKGELTDANTVTISRLNAAGEPSGAALVLHRAPK